MDERVKALARGALRRLGPLPSGPPPPPPPPASAGEEALRISSLTLPELSRLAYLQAGDPLVDKVLQALRSGRPVYLDRPAVERALGLAQYPPRVREWFSRWFVRISGLGVALVGQEEGPPLPEVSPSAPPPPAPAGAPLTPDRQVLREILGEVAPEPHPCWLEPGKACCGSGRCKTLGF